MKKLIPIIFALAFIVSCKKQEDVKPQQTIVQTNDPLNVGFTLHSNRTPYWFWRRVNGSFLLTKINSKDTVIIDPYQKDNGMYKNIVTMQTYGIKGDYLSIKAYYMGKTDFSETKNDGVYFAWVAQENYK